MEKLQKFDITYHEEREAFYTIEAHSKEEAERIFANRMRNDDYFCDEVAEFMENNVVDEEINAFKADDDSVVDFSYEEMTKEVE